MARLAEKVALVTGSSQGIGRATAIAMAREGADVVVNGRPDEVAEAFVFLASPAGDYITGHTLVIDGGLELDFGKLTSGLRSQDYNG